MGVMHYFKVLRRASCLTWNNLIVLGRTTSPAVPRANLRPHPAAGRLYQRRDQGTLELLRGAPGGEGRRREEEGGGECEEGQKDKLDRFQGG